MSLLARLRRPHPTKRKESPASRYVSRFIRRALKRAKATGWKAPGLPK